MCLVTLVVTAKLGEKEMADKKEGLAGLVGVGVRRKMKGKEVEKS